MRDSAPIEMPSGTARRRGCTFTIIIALAASLSGTIDPNDLIFGIIVSAFHRATDTDCVNCKSGKNWITQHLNERNNNCVIVVNITSERYTFRDNRIDDHRFFVILRFL